MHLKNLFKLKSQFSNFQKTIQVKMRLIYINTTETVLKKRRIKELYVDAKKRKKIGEKKLRNILHQIELMRLLIFFSDGKIIK